MGGVWEKITDRFLIGAGNEYAAGDTGGEASVKLKLDNYRFGVWSPNDFTWKQVSAHIGNSGNYGAACAYSSSYEQNNVAHNNMPPYVAVNMWQRTA